MATSPVLKTRLVTLFAFFVTSVAAVTGMYAISSGLNSRQNGFIRLFPPHAAAPLRSIDIKHNSFYVAGVTPGKILLANTTAVTTLMTMGPKLVDTQMIQLNIQGAPGLLQGRNLVTADTANIYVTDGRIPLIATGKIGELHLDTIHPVIGFNAAVPVSSTSYVIKMYDGPLSQFILAKTSCANDLIKVPSALEKQGDGVFSVDGMLNVDAATGKIVYIYYYRNQIICLDSNLHLLFRHNTIDTIAHANIKTSRIASNNTITLSNPPLTVNRLSCVADGWIFVNSKLLANNEDKETFNHCSVVDVYSLKDGQYHLSFYLPDFNGSKITSFKVYNKMLIAVYDHYLFSYHLNF